MAHSGAAAAAATATAEPKPKIVFQEIPKYPTRENMGNLISTGLDPNRPLPKPVPDFANTVPHDWDRHKAIPPKYLEVHWRDYAARYIPEAPQLSFLERLFGSPEMLKDKTEKPRGQPYHQVTGTFAHPCHATSQRVRDCLDRNAEKEELAPDYCRGIINVFEGCLREYRI